MILLIWRTRGQKSLIMQYKIRFIRFKLYSKHQRLPINQIKLNFSSISSSGGPSLLRVPESPSSISSRASYHSSREYSEFDNLVMVRLKWSNQSLKCCIDSWYVFSSSLRVPGLTSSKTSSHGVCPSSDFKSGLNPLKPSFRFILKDFKVVASLDQAAWCSSYHLLWSKIEWSLFRPRSHVSASQELSRCHIDGNAVRFSMASKLALCWTRTFPQFVWLTLTQMD